MKTLDLIVPCYNEQAVLPLFYEAVQKTLQTLPDYQTTLIFVDDGSSDQTLETLQRFAAQDSRVRYLSFSRNFGKESAMLAGLRASTAALVGILDADLQHSPALLPEMLRAIADGYDVAAAKRMDRTGESKLKSRLSDVTAAIRLSRATIRNIHQNLFWAFFYNAVCIPLAMGLYGIEMKPMYGAAAMALSSFFVCMNALRLNLFKPYSSEHDRKAVHTDHEAVEKAVLEITTKEEKIMTKTITIEGMMCPHCEASVKKALEEIAGVESAAADHTAGTAVVTLSAPVEDEVLKAAVEAKDYKVCGIS